MPVVVVVAKHMAGGSNDRRVLPRLAAGDESRAAAVAVGVGAAEAGVLLQLQL